MIEALAAASIATALQVDWPTRSGFDIVRYRDACELNGSWPMPGRQPIRVTIFHDGGDPILIMSSGDWTARPDEEFELSVLLDREAFSGPAQGLPPEVARSGFSVIVDDSFLNDFAAANTMTVFRGEVIVADLGLARTGQAVQDLRACQRHAAGLLAQQQAEEQAVSYVARDPFADGPAGGTRSHGVRPSILTNPTWAIAPLPEVPARAVADGVNGQVALSCTVTRSASVSDCSIVSETPTGYGFGRSALSSMRAARLTPSSVDSVAPGGTVRFTLNFEVR